MFVCFFAPGKEREFVCFFACVVFFGYLGSILFKATYSIITVMIMPNIAKILADISNINSNHSLTHPHLQNLRMYFLLSLL